MKLWDDWHNPLHTLWSQATACHTYVKADWMKLESILFRSSEAAMKLGATGTQATITKLPDEWFELLHRLWTKGTERPDYVKADWMKLESILLQGAGAIARLQANQDPERP